MLQTVNLQVGRQDLSGYLIYVPLYMQMNWKKNTGLLKKYDHEYRWHSPWPRARS